MVRVKGGTKRRERPTVLTVQEYEVILALLKEPYRTMVIVAQCLGLRVSEIAALQWDDFDFEKNQLLVQRSFVSGHVDDVKTEYSRDYVHFTNLWRGAARMGEGSLANRGRLDLRKSSHKQAVLPTEIQKRHIHPAGCCLVACPKCKADVGVWCKQDGRTPNGKRLLITRSGKLSLEEWPNRLAYVPSYLSFLAGRDWSANESAARIDAPCSIQTTMNVYGQAMSSSKREANSKIVEMVLKPLKASA